MLFRVGDFYELCGEDAEIAARTLGLSLTHRIDRDTGEPTSFAGSPCQSLESYLRQLLAAGHRVAICEPCEDAEGELAQQPAQATLFD